MLFSTCNLLMLVRRMFELSTFFCGKTDDALPFSMVRVIDEAYPRGLDYTTGFTNELTTPRVYMILAGSRC